MPTTVPSCRPRTKRRSSGSPVRNGTSVEPGLANIVVNPRRRKRSKVASRTSRAMAVYTTAVNPADLGVLDAAGALARRDVSAQELTDACLERIRERDGTHSHDGDPESINAWVRVYEEDAREASAAADERLARGEAPLLCGIPIGLRALYGVAGKPVTASSAVLAEVPERDCDAWARLRAEGMVLLGHLHTHEFACGGTTDQV